jgi:hypothetical protein
MYINKSLPLSYTDLPNHSLILFYKNNVFIKHLLPVQDLAKIWVYKVRSCEVFELYPIDKLTS